MKLSRKDKEYIVNIMTEGFTDDWDDREEKHRLLYYVDDEDLYNEFKELFPELLGDLDLKG